MEVLTETDSKPCAECGAEYEFIIDEDPGVCEYCLKLVHRRELRREKKNYTLKETSDAADNSQQSPGGSADKDLPR